MKIRLSESQIQKLREVNPDFVIAPYPTVDQYKLYDPEGYKRSKELGTLDLYYPNRPPEPPAKRGRPPRLSMSNIASTIDPKELGDIKFGTWVSTYDGDYKIIHIDKDKIIGRSFCNPTEEIPINKDDIIDVNVTGREKFHDLKLDFTKYYEEAGLAEDYVSPARKKYLGGTNVVLFLDDRRKPFTGKKDWVQKFSQIGTEDIHVVHAKTYEEFVDYIQNNGLPKQIIFDHDLGLTDDTEYNGCSAAVWLVKYCMKTKEELPKWTISSANKYGKCCIGNVLRKYEDLIKSSSTDKPQPDGSEV